MRYYRNLIIPILLFVVILSIGWFLWSSIHIADAKDKETAIITRLVDLDTFELNNGLRVRLLCINAPEKEQPWTSHAQTKIAAQIVGREVTLVRDVSDKDDYGRLLRHVYLNDSIWIQEVIVRSGFARVKPYEPDTTRCSMLESARLEAEQESLGIWAAKPPICDKDVYDCDDFASTQQAEALFAICGGSEHDIHGLDGDKDGEICEELS